jgi:hypothetical protein
MELLLIVVGLVLLGLAAARFGQDSREPGEVGAPWHTWRDARALPDPAGLDVEATFRLEELRAVAARERLLRPAGTAALPVRQLSAHQAAVAWLGAALVRVGERLQGYGRAASSGC